MGAFLLVGCSTPVEPPPNANAGHIALLRVASEHRLLLPLLAGQRAVESCSVASPLGPRCLSAARPQARLALRSARRRVERAAGTVEATEQLHSLGLAVLLGEAKVGAAVELLEQAAESRPRDPFLLTDLAAAYFVRGAEEDRPLDFAAGLEAVEIALEEAPRLEAALFNRDLIRGALHLGPAGAPVPAWRETPLSLADLGDLVLVERWTRENPQKVRLLIEETLFGAWATSEPDEAASILAVLAQAGVTFERERGDAMIRDAAAVIQLAEQRRDHRRLAVLRSGHGEFALGLGLFAKHEFSLAATHFAQAASQLEKAGSPFGLWSSFYHAVCLFFEPAYDASLGELDALEREIGDARYPNVLGRVQWMKGLLYLMDGRFGPSLAHYERALALFQATGEAAYVAYIHTLIAKNLRLAGAKDAAWRHEREALAGRDLLASRDRVFSILLEASDSCLDHSLPRAALAFFDEQLAAAREADRPFLEVEAQLRRARVFLTLGNYEAADRACAAARAGMPAVERKSLGRAMADLGAVEGTLTLRRDPAAALHTLQDSLAYFRSTGGAIEALPLFPLLAQAQRASGDAGAAQETLDQGLSEAERQRGSLLAPDQRAAYLASARELFEAAITFALESGDSARAFSLAERLRNRTLAELRWRTQPDRAEIGSQAGVDLAQVRERLPPGALLVTYTVLPDRLLRWVVSQHRAALEVEPVDRSSLKHLVLRFRAERVRGSRDPQRSPAGHSLARLLLPSALSELAEEAPVLVAPTKCSYEVPFAALPLVSDDRLLVEKHSLRVLPNLGLAVAAPPPVPLAAPSQRLLVVGNPAFPASLFPGLSSLAAAEEEARELAGLYPGARLLTNSNATPSAVLAGLQGKTLFQFAGHAIADSANGAASGLLLAAEPGEAPETALLQAQEIAGLDLRSLDLVVLAACSTAVGTYPESEETANLATAFLAAGAGAVVASAWEVLDEPTRKLTLLLHRALAAGAPPAEALRRAQRALLAEPDTRTSSAWDAFRLLAAGF